MNKIGVMLGSSVRNDFRGAFRRLKAMGIDSCQFGISGNPEIFNDDYAKALKEALEAEDFEISLFWVGLSGPAEWNFTGGPVTIGFVPEQYRKQRVEEMKLASLFAEKVGVKNLCTHAGFLPENPTDPLYPPVLAALTEVCQFLKEHGQNFLFETGQETPVTLLRFIEAIGTGNVFINFDTGNVILYGKANSADAVRVFGKYVRDTHIKDGLYPTDGTNLGREVKVGEGLANIPLVYSLLREYGYEGPLTIEREISGEAQQRDIADTIAYLKAIMTQ